MGERSSGAMRAVRRHDVDVVQQGLTAGGLLPVLPALQDVVPGLRRGQVLQVEHGALAIALIAAASAAGTWTAVVGMPDFGVLSAAAMGCDVDRLLLVDDPGEHWATVVAAVVEAADVVLLRSPAGGPPPGVTRRIGALARMRGACVLAAGPWEGAMTRVRVESSVWTGVDRGHGHLRGRRAKVVADGRGAGGRPRSAWVWLPGPDGAVSRADLVSVDGDSEHATAGRALVGAVA